MPDSTHSLYRRWRSRTFAELVGQEHVSRTLLAALQTRRIAHAYLFTGPRGTGKTSTARILAKAVNCLNNDGCGEPCNQCEMCVSINEGHALDLIEIDAASNRGIDEIRDLRDKVHFAPTQARYKVYILDEAHMLTNEAFNALLKTLEEPPPHVIFALVTTEPHKIPPTILSRCQRFDFHRAALKDILAKLTRICQEENITIEPAALSLIARTATGSYRDAESLLDQLASFTGSEGITLTYVQQVLGLAPVHAAGQLVSDIAGRDVAAGLKLLNDVLEGGTDLRQFNREIIDYLRNLLLIKTSNVSLLNLAPDTIQEMTTQAGRFSVPVIVRLIRIFSECEVSGGQRSGSQPQLALELAFLEACGELAHPQASDAVRAAGTSHEETASPAGAMGQPSVAPAASVRSPTPATASQRPAVQPSPRPYTPSAAGRPAAMGGAAAADGRSAYQPAASAPARPVYGRVQVAVTAPPGSPLADIQSNWPAILEHVKAISRSVEAFLKECRPVEMEADLLTLGFFYPFHRESVENPKNRMIVEGALAQVVGHPVRIRCSLTPKDGRLVAAAPPTQERLRAVEADPVVRAAEEIFDAKVLAVEEAENGAAGGQEATGKTPQA